MTGFLEHVLREDLQATSAGLQPGFSHVMAPSRERGGRKGEGGPLLRCCKY